MLKLMKKGQSTVEYAILLIIILGAFVGAQNYFVRGIQGRWKTAVDDLGEQYDPRVADTNVRHVIASNTITRILALNVLGGVHTSREDTTETIETRTGVASVGAY